MWKILEKFQKDFLDSIINDWLAAIQGICDDIATKTFHFEKLFGDAISSTAVEQAYNAMYMICCTLLVLKLLWKGWNVYILWSGGDPEVAPGELLKNSAWAIVVTAAFPLGYDIGINIALEIVHTVVSFFSLSGTGWNSGSALIDALGNVASAGSYSVLLGLIFGILYIILVIVMLKQGAELLVFRLGIPLAAIGLVNSDGGAWTGYIQMLFKQVFSVMVQYFCVVVGIAVYCSGGGVTSSFAAIALEIMAFAAPKLLSQVLIPGGGGGVAQKVTAVSTVIRTFAK